MQTLTIESELTIATAAEQKTALLAFLNTDDELEINLSKVSEFDVEGIQLLTMINKEATQNGKKLRFVMLSNMALGIAELTNRTAPFGKKVLKCCRT